MPGHGEPIINTYAEWFTRINKRVARLERRMSRTPTPPTPTTFTAPGATGTIYAVKSGGVVSIWAGSTVQLTSGSIPVGTTDLIATGSGVIPAQFLPTVGGNRFGVAYLAGAYAGLVGVNGGGRLQIYNQTGAARSSVQFTITFIP